MIYALSERRVDRLRQEVVQFVEADRVKFFERRSALLVCQYTAMADKKRAAALKELDAIGFDELDDFLAETIHTAFRKGIDHPQSMVIWRAIRELPSDQWSTG